jgi:hypothetical protein
MKELSQIIEDLHNINQQVIEKDNYINLYSDTINLFSLLVNDEQFKKSDIYLDLRAKYLAQIEEKLKKISESQITIEPENLQTTKPNTTVFSGKAVVAPLKTDIYMAPKNRKHFAKKKNIDIQMVEDDTNSSHEYIEFEHNEKSYYIDTTPIKNANANGTSTIIYNIYDYMLNIMGSLDGIVLTLINHMDLSNSEQIKLHSCNPTELNFAHEKLLENYVIKD